MDMTYNLTLKWFSFSLILGLISCAPKPNDAFKQMLLSSKNNDYNKINLAGAYHDKVDEPEAYLRCPVYFFSNGLVYYEFGFTVLDSSTHTAWLHKYLESQHTWGTYEIKGNTVNAIIFYSYTNSIVRYLPTHYQGVIKNKDTILHWHITKPYPNVKSQVEKELFSRMLQDNPDLFFKPLSVKTFMDSVSDRIWLNKTRK